MTEQIQQANVSSDELMTKALRACGFHVRTLNLAPGQRPQVVGNIDHAVALFQLTIAGTDANAAGLDSQRAEFEAWMAKNAPRTNIGRLTSGQYEAPPVEDLWQDFLRRPAVDAGGHDYGHIERARVKLATMKAIASVQGLPQFVEAIHGVIVMLDAARTPAVGAADQDADRLAKLLEFCTEAKPQFGPRGELRAMTMKFKNSVETSIGFRKELRKMIDEMQPTAKGGAA